MEAVVRPIGRVIFSCVLSGLYQGFLRVHRKTMRSLFVHGDISRRIKRRHRTEKPVKNVAFLGVEGSGKTVLTHALVRTFKAHEGDGWYLRPDSRESFRFLAQLPDELTSENLPHQTTSLKRLSWSVQLHGRTQRMLDILDYPGEIYRLAFLNAKDDPDPLHFAQRVAANREDIDALFAHLAEADQIFVLFNLSDAEDVAKNSTNLDAVWVTNACLDYLHRLPHKPTVALLLTQIDRYADLADGVDDLSSVVARHLPLVHHNFPDLDVLGVSALGLASATFGIDEILLRCLYDSEAVKPVVHELKTLSGQVDDLISKMNRFQNGPCDSLSRIGGLLAQCESLADRLPWFVSRTQLAALGLHIDQSENEEVRFLARIRSDLPSKGSPDVRMAAIENARTQLQRSVLRTDIGMSLRTSLLNALNAGISACERDEERKRKMDAGLSLVIAALVVVGILILVFSLSGI